MPKRIGWWATTMITLLVLTWVGLFAVELTVPHVCRRARKGSVGNSSGALNGRITDDDLDTRTGYDARSYFALVQFQKGTAGRSFDSLDEHRKTQLSVGAVRANRTQFGIRLLIGEDARG